MIGPLAVAIATKFPLLTLTIIYEVRQRCCRRPSDQMKTEEESTEMPDVKKIDIDGERC